MVTEIDARRALFREMADRTRWRAYLLLSSLGDLRPGTLARLIGVSEVVMRRHLQVMEELGLVTGRQDGPRTRVWSTVPAKSSAGPPTGLQIDLTSEQDAALAASREVGEWLRVVVEASEDVLKEFFERRGTISPEWLIATEAQEYVLQLRQDELAQLSAELRATVEKWLPTSRSRVGAPDPDSVPVYVVTHAIPYPRRGDG